MAHCVSVLRVINLAPLAHMVQLHQTKDDTFSVAASLTKRVFLWFTHTRNLRLHH